MLAASVRRGGKSLAEIARSELGPWASNVASAAILFIVVIALAGLGFVVVKALGGDEVKLAERTEILLPEGKRPQVDERRRIPAAERCVQRRVRHGAAFGIRVQIRRDFVVGAAAGAAAVGRGRGGRLAGGGAVLFLNRLLDFHIRRHEYRDVMLYLSRRIYDGSRQRSTT